MRTQVLTTKSWGLIPFIKNVATIKFINGANVRVVSFTQCVRCGSISFSIFFRDCRCFHTLQIGLCINWGNWYNFQAICLGQQLSEERNEAISACIFPMVLFTGRYKPKRIEFQGLDSIKPVAIHPHARGAHSQQTKQIRDLIAVAEFALNSQQV
jgi:hypothetical protein